MNLAVQWLELNDPLEAIPLKTVLELAQHGGDRRSEQFKAENQGSVRTLKRGENAAAIFRFWRGGRGVRQAELFLLSNLRGGFSGDIPALDGPLGHFNLRPLLGVSEKHLARYAGGKAQPMNRRSGILSE